MKQKLIPREEQKVNCMDVISQNCKQESPVDPPDRLFKITPDIFQNIIVFNQQNQDRKQADRRIIQCLYQIKVRKHEG